ncbi:MAG: SH3 domain-containing protein, partial [Endomicrobium sp.]|nr:SH3 domain-containing protein [Endomicrobium sp.]
KVLFSINKKYESYYNSALKRVGSKHIESILNTIDYGYCESASFAITVKSSYLRVLPTQDPLYSSKNSTNLDRLQVTQLDFASPLIVLYSTINKEWYYVISEIAEGWISVDSIAFGSKEDIAEYKKRKNIAVVISKQSDLYKDSKVTDFYDTVRMGSVLPVSKIAPSYYEVNIPFVQDNKKLGFKKVFVKKSDVFLGFLPYTQANVITQAFKYLDTPYGWGDDSGYPDCSSFVRQVFSCFGILFPKNSGAQSQVGNIAIKFDKQETNEQKTKVILEQAVPGITTLYFQGHIMLYLGYNNGQAYAIHSLHGYGGENNLTYLLNRVTVSSLLIGEHSKKGSLLNRLTLMKVIK